MTGAQTLLRSGRQLVVSAAILLGASGTALAEDASRSHAQHAPAITPMSATYGATMDKGIAIDGSATRTLEQQADGSWLYRFNVNSFIADIEESVVFQWDSGRIIPLQYRYSLKGMLVPNRSRAINFNHGANTINGTYEGDSFSMEMEDNALDPLGFQLQLRQDLQAGKRDMTYAVADDGDYDHDRFAVIGEETLTTPIGNVSTVKVEKVRDGDSKRQTLMWFAPELDYLLVQLVQVEPDGSRYEVNIEEADLPQ